MNRWIRSHVLGWLVPVTCGIFGGCQSSSNPPVAEQPAASTKESRIDEAMAQLSESDRAEAINQRICPVSDAPLGSMGAPLKVDVDGRGVFICCAGCEDILKGEADKYLAKLPPAGAVQ